MKLLYHCLIDELCSDDPTRIVLNSVSLEIPEDRKKAQLVATDGRRIAILPVEVSDADKAGLIPSLALKLARDIEKQRAQYRWDQTNDDAFDEPGGGLAFEPVEIDCSDTAFVGVAGGVKIGRNSGNYPNWRAVTELPAPKYRIALNAELLAGIQRAFDTSAVVLEIAADDKGLRVLPRTGIVNRTYLGGAYAVLMPVRADGTGEVT